MATIQKFIQLYAWETNYHIFRIVKGECDSRSFHIQLINVTDPIDLTDCTVNLFVVKPDSTKLYIPCEILEAEQGRIRVTLVGQVAAVVGTVNCWIQVAGAAGTDLRFEGMSIEVSDCQLDESVSSSDDLPALRSLMSELTPLIAEANEAIENSKMLARDVAFIPTISPDGILSWTNGMGLSNPSSINLYNGVFDLKNYAESSESGYHFDSSLSPTNMTIMIRNAITYVSNLGFKMLRFPANQTIVVGVDSTTGGTKKNGGILFQLPERFTLDLNGSTIKLNPNDYTKKEYLMCNLAGDYSQLCNGTLIGDYAAPSGSAQWGHAVRVGGSYCKVENLKIQDFLGDGIYISSKGLATVELNSSTNWAVDTTNACVYTSLIDISTLIANGETEMKVRLYNPTANYFPFCKVEFYNSSSSLVSNVNLKTQKSVMATDIMIPAGSKYVKVYIYSRDFYDETVATNFIENFSHTYLRGITFPCRGNLVKNVVIKHIGRNGITLGYTNQTTITNFVISDCNGTAPKACIDIEEGRNEGYNCTIKNGWLTSADFGISFSANLGIIIENMLMNSFTKSALYGLNSAQVSIDNSIIVGTIECGSGYLANSKISNSILVSTIYAHNYDFSSCKIFTGAIQVDGMCTIRDCYISNGEVAGQITVTGIFENCLFDGRDKKVSIRISADAYGRINWANVTTSFYNCYFKDLSTLNLKEYTHSKQSGYLSVDTMSGCRITTYRLDGVTARQVVNSTFDGMDYYNGSTYHQPIFKCGLISGCLFDRSLNASGKGVSYKGVIVVQDDGTNYVPEAYIITNNRFIGLVTSSDYALAVNSITVPVYFNGNYGLQKTVDESTTVQLGAVKDNTSGAATIDSSNNYGFLTT